MLLVSQVRCAEPEQFEAVCSTCNYHIQHATPINIVTNRVDPVMGGNGGYSNAVLTVTLVCPNNHTNDYGSQMMIRRPWATHVLRPALPRPEQPPAIPLTITNETIVTVRVPAGFEVRIVPTVNTNK